MGAFWTIIFILLFIVFSIALVFLLGLLSAVLQLGADRHLELHMEDEEDEDDKGKEDGIIYEDDE